MAAAPSPQGAIPPAPPQPTDAYPQAANISSLMQTPEQAYQAQLAAHPLRTRLQMFAAGVSGGPSGQEQERETLAARQQQPLALAQAKAQFAGMQALYAQLPPDQRAAFILDPKGYTDQYIKNQALVKLGTNDVLANASAPGGLAPPVPSNPAYAGADGGILATAGPNAGNFTGVSQPVTVAAGTSAVPFTPTVGGTPAAPAQTAPAGAPNPAASSMVVNGKLDPAAFFKGFTLPHEGGLNPSDMNGSPTNYGFNQKANMDINVKKLTPESATSRFVSKYYPAGSDNMAPALAAVNADTSFINPGAAQRFLAQSGGDPTKYMALRQAWMAHMVATNPAAAKYANAWQKRNDDLGALAGQLGGLASNGAVAPVANPASPAAPAGSGFGVPIVQGKTNQDIPFRQAIAEGLAPGRWQIDPTGKKVQVSAPPKGDMDRLTSLQDTTAGLQNLVREQQQFSADNAKTGTAIVYDNPEFHGIGLNPVADIAERTNPNLKSMAASEAQQLFMVKPANVGARILQSELPFWERQTQSISNTGDVNYGILQRNQRELSLAQQQSDFYQQYVYQHGNLNGADAAWAHIEGRGGAPGPSASAALSDGDLLAKYGVK